MTQETKALETDLKEIAEELWPLRPNHLLSIDDGILLLGVLLRRQLSLKIDKLKPAYAEGGEPQNSARGKSKFDFPE